MKRVFFPVLLLCHLMLVGGNLRLPAQETGHDPQAIPTPETFEKLTQALNAYPDGTAPPKPLELEVTAALEAALELAPDGARLPKHLDTLALAAAPHPRWHGILLKLTTRLKPRIVKYSSYRDWFAVRELTRMLELGCLVPDVDLQIIPTKLGNASVSWTLPGLLVADAQPANPRFLPWPVLASSLAGKFDGVLSEEPLGGGESRILKRWPKLPATAQFTLENLPAVGQIRMNLRSLDHPEVIVRCRLAGFNTLPVLMDTTHPPPVIPPAPEGLEWLSPPQPLTEVSQWMVSFAGGITAPLTDDRIWLVLLDPVDAIIGARRIQYREGWPDLEEYRAMPGSLIRQTFIRPDPDIFQNAAAPMQIGGPPRRFGLVRSTKDRLQGQTRPPPSITVQTCPLPAEEKIPVAGRLEAIRVWQQTTDEDVRVAVGGSPPTMAWYRAGKLTLCGIGEHTVPRTIDVPVPKFPCPYPQLIWQGGMLRLFFSRDLADEISKPETTLITIGINADTKPSLLGLPTVLSAMPTSPDVDSPLLLKGFRNQLIGVLPMEGPLVTLSSALSGGRPLAVDLQVSPTEARCENPQGGPPVALDWSDGTLKITHLDPERRPWFLPEPSVWNTMGNGRVSNPAITPREDWELDIGADQIRPMGDNFAYGTTKNAVVLYKMMPAVPPQGKGK